MEKSLGKSGFLLYHDQRPFFALLADKEARALILAVFDYEVTRTEPQPISPAADMAFVAIRQTLDRNRLKHNEIVERRREYGKLGGKAKASLSQHKLAKPSKASYTDTDTDTDSVTDTDTDSDTSKRKRKRNELADALSTCEGGPEGVTAQTWKKIGKALADIKAATPDVTPEEILRRIANYKTHMQNCACTATAMASHWAKCATAKPEQSTLPQVWHDPANPKRNLNW
jgi:hypothetical protein